MKSEQERLDAKAQYEKPAAVDLGPTAPVVGASCAYGDEVSEGLCAEVGNAATGDCISGGGAAAFCFNTGSDPGKTNGG